MSTILTERINGETAWSGSSLSKSDEWIYRFSTNDLQEIDSALTVARKRALPIGRLTAADFPLPNLSRDLQLVSQELEYGRGFVQMKGLQVERYTEQEARLIYCGIGAHLGTPVSQNAKGDLIGDVRDEGVTLRDGKVRGYQTNSASPFHADECDVVGLLCLRPAKEGGLSRLVSSMAIYNELLARHPYYVAMLYEPFYFDWRGENEPGEASVYRWPVYEYYDRRLTCRYSRRMIEFGYKRLGIALHPVQLEAFDILDETISELQLDINFEPGDIQFLNNYTILHSRTGFQDYDEPGRRRHLLRLWLTSMNGRKLSEEVTKERNVRSGVPVRPSFYWPPVGG